MERTLLAPGVHLSYDPAPRLNRCRISIHFTFPIRRQTATAHALYIHRSTLTYRLEKMQELTGIDLADPDTRLYLQISIKLLESL